MELVKQEIEIFTEPYNTDKKKSDFYVFQQNGFLLFFVLNNNCWLMFQADKKGREFNSNRDKTIQCFSISSERLQYLNQLPDPEEFQSKQKSERTKLFQDVFDGEDFLSAIEILKDEPEITHQVSLIFKYIKNLKNKLIEIGVKIQ